MQLGCCLSLVEPAKGTWLVWGRGPKRVTRLDLLNVQSSGGRPHSNSITIGGLYYGPLMYGNFQLLFLLRHLQVKGSYLRLSPHSQYRDDFFMPPRFVTSGPGSAELD